MYTKKELCTLRRKDCGCIPPTWESLILPACRILPCGSIAPRFFSRSQYLWFYYFDFPRPRSFVWPDFFFLAFSPKTCLYLCKSHPEYWCGSFPERWHPPRCWLEEDTQPGPARLHGATAHDLPPLLPTFLSQTISWMRFFRAKPVFTQEAQIIPQVISAATNVRKVKFSHLSALEGERVPSFRSLEKKRRPPATSIILEGASEGSSAPPNHIQPSLVHQEAGIWGMRCVSSSSGVFEGDQSQDVSEVSPRIYL